jgi:GR25 family glycosyltransferase involved in LPS biosynthesis
MIASAHVIHIADRKDREQTMQTLRANLQEQLNIQTTVFFATKQRDGRKGCYESHVAVMKRALLLSNDKHALILEDDAEFAADLSTSLRRQLLLEALDFAKSHSFDILFLGSFPNMFVANDTVKVSKFQHIFKTNPSTTHAYIASSSFMKRMTERFSDFQGVAIDDFFKSNVINTFALYPSIILQSNSESDIASPLASFVSKSGLKNFVWRFAETFSTSISLSLKHILFVALSLCVLLYQLSSFKPD